MAAHRAPAGAQRSTRPRDIPFGPELDATLAFMREGYAFIGRRCDRLGVDAFRTRIMLQPAICMRGAGAAAVFYDADRVGRQQAMPKSTLRLLQDEGSVQLLGGHAHRVRKRLFLDMMSPESLERARADFAAALAAAVPRWQRRGEIVLHDAMRDVLTETAARWAGIALPAREVPERSREFSAMIDHAGSFGPTNWWAQSLRRRSEAWARDLVAGVRKGELQVPPGTPLAAVAAHVDADGRQLDLETAGVELLNVLRPIVAVGRYVVFAALALWRFPVWREAFRAGDQGDLEGFVHEVRRFYPFFPAVGGRVIEPFEWHEHRFAAGDWLLLDLYGTCHDARHWPSPGVFRPERFRDWTGDPHTLVPQGAGAFETGHRCPGEWLTIELMKEAVRQLSRHLRFSVPMQDLSVSLARLPARPESAFVISDVSYR